MGPEFRLIATSRTGIDFAFLGYRALEAQRLQVGRVFLSQARLGERSRPIGSMRDFPGHLSGSGISCTGDGQESVPAADLAGRILSNFDFNMLVPAFLPVRGRGRQRAETEQNRDKMIDAIRTFLNELVRYRFVELRPRCGRKWRDLQVYRLPGLQRFGGEPQRASASDSEATDLPGGQTLWAGFADRPESDDSDDAAEDEWTALQP